MESTEVFPELTLASSRWTNPVRGPLPSLMIANEKGSEEANEVDSTGATATVAPVTAHRAMPHRWIDQVQLVDGKLVFVPDDEKTPTSIANDFSKERNDDVTETASAKPGTLKETPVGTPSSGVAVATPRRSKQLTPTHSPHEMDGNEKDLSQRDSAGTDAHLPGKGSSAVAVATPRHSAASSISVQIKTEDQPQTFNPFFSNDNVDSSLRANARNAEHKRYEFDNPAPSVKVEVGTDAASSTKGFKASKRSSRWPTNRELTHPPEPQDDAVSDIPSDQADPGFGEATIARRIEKNAGTYQLADWEGNFAPAPVDWEDRPLFADAFIQSRIKVWTKDSVDQDHHAVELGHEGATLGGEIAIRSWIPEQIESMTPDEFWTQHQREPTVEKSRPWWQTYVAEGSEELEVPKAPEAPIDFKDNDTVKLQQTAERSLLKHHNVKLTQERETKANRRRERAEAKAAAQYIVPENPFSPRINIYLRPAEDDDLPQILEIYNYYVENTACCPEIDPMSLAEMKTWYEAIADGRIPFLVAVEPSPAIMTGDWRKNKIQRYPERVVGFAFADEYHDMHAMYRYTVEVSVYTKPDKVGKGVGRCLFDKILNVLDPHYVDKGGYEFKGDETVYCSGGARTVASVLVNVPYISTDSERIDWLEAWLKKFHFEKVTDLHEIGHKLGKTYAERRLVGLSMNKGQLTKRI